MSKFYYIFLVFIFAITVFGQSPGKMSEKEKKRKLLIAKIERTEDGSSVLGVLRKFNMDMTKEHKDGKMLTSKEYSNCSTRLNIWIKYRWFIADTKLSKKWLVNVKKLVDYMLKTKDFIETAQANRSIESAKYKQAVKYFDVAYKRLVKLIKKPVKVSLKSVRKAKLKKALWQKAMRKKYKIKDNIQVAEF